MSRLRNLLANWGLIKPPPRGARARALGQTRAQNRANAGGIAMPNLQQYMRTHSKRRRSRGDNLRAIVLASVLAGGLFGVTTYWVGLTVNERRADMGDEFDFIKAAVLAHSMGEAMGPDGVPRIPCPDLTGDGVAAEVCGPGELEGLVPWRTLGIGESETVNSWGIPVIYKVDRPNANTCAGRLPRRGNLILTRQFENDDQRTMVNAVFVIQSVKPNRQGRTDLTFLDAGTGGLFIGLCQNADVMRTYSF